MNWKIDILSPGGELLREHILSASCSRKFSLMSEDSITLRFWTREAMKFPIGSSVGNFFITEKQEGKWNASDGVWDYELKFDAYYLAWKNKILRYIINGVDSAKETSFLLTATIDLHAQVILNCLNALGITYGDSPFRVDTTDTSLSAEAKLVRYENLSILGGIQAIAEAFDCEWWVSENAIYFGRCENSDSKHIFEAGINTSSITFQQAKTEAPNRLYVYGSDRNLPTNYRQVDGNDTIGGVVARRLMLPEGTPYLQTRENIPEAEIVEQVVVLDRIYPRTDLTVTEEPETYSSSTEDEDGNSVSETYYRLKYDPTFLFSESYVLPNEELHIIFQSGMLNGMEFGAKFNPKGLNERNSDGSWNPDAQMIEVVVNEDYGRRLPDDILKPQKGDKFILSGWDATKMEDLGLIADAELELLEEGRKALEEYTKDLSTCSCPMAWDYMKPLFAENKQPKPGDVVTIIDTAHFGEGGRKSRIIGFEYKLDKPYAECIYTCGENVSVKRLDSIEKKIDGLAKTGTKVQIQNSLDFLSKRYRDRTPYMLSSEEGFEVGDFLAGVSGARIAKDKESGRTYGELDELYVRVKAYFESLTVVEREALAGEQQVTPGGGVKCTSVVAVDANGNVLEDINSSLVTAYRCYFLSEQDGEKRDVFIKAGDQAISQEWNAKEDDYNKVSNRRWWRLVTAVNQDALTDDVGNHYGYIEVSKADCEVNSDIPQAGDEIVQFGNRTDATRQTAIVISTVASDAPSMKLFTGIGSGEVNAPDTSTSNPYAKYYTLDEKDIISYGYDRAKGRAYMCCYGDFYYGDKDGKTWIKYDAGEKTLEAKLKLHLESTIGDKPIGEYFQSLLPEDKESYLEKALKQDTTIDGGLMLTSSILLGYNDPLKGRATMAGHNGLIPDTMPEANRGKAIASFWGGNMSDRFYDSLGNPLETEPTDFANALVRMDGTGYWCGGNIRFEKDYALFGSETLGVRIGADGSFQVGSGVKFGITNVDGLNTQLNDLANFNIGLNNLFRVIDKDGNERDLSYAFTNWDDVESVKVMRGLWTEQYLSARGKNPDAYEGPAGLDEAQLSEYLSEHGYLGHLSNVGIHVTPGDKQRWNETADNLSSILGSDANGVIDRWDEIVGFLNNTEGANTLADLLSHKADKLTEIIADNGLQGGGYLESDVTISLARSGVVPDTYIKVTVDEYGRVTDGDLLSASDIPSLTMGKITGLQTALDNKVSKSGDTMTGLLTLNAGAKIAGSQKLVIGECEITWDGTGLKFSKGIWSEGYVSARGSNPDAVAGGFLTSVSWADVEDKPTTLAGYGITDAKIENGVVKLGGQTFAHQSLANYVTLDTAQTISGIKTLGLRVGNPDGSEIDRVIITPYGHTGSWRISSYDTPSTAYLRIKYGTTIPFAFSHDGTFIAGSIVKTGGTSTQFLKADGSVDSTAYLPKSGGSMSNTNVVSNLNADLLDGVHLSGLFLVDSYSADANALTVSGVYKTGADITNNPAGSNGDQLIHFNWDINAANQLYLRYYADEMYFRRKAGNVWKPWKKLAFVSDITSAVANYLPLTGGTLKNGASVTPLILNTDSTVDIGMGCQLGGTSKGWIGYSTSAGACLYNYAKNWYFGIKDDGNLFYSGGTIWHSGNDGSGSGLDADLLDGRHASSFVNRTSGSGADNLAILKALHPTLADSVGHAVRLEHGSHSYAFGWFLSGYAFANAYGGWFISDYGTPRWIGVDNGTWNQHTFAFTDSNVASASRLQGTSTYSAWGKTFWQNGVPNSISGELTDVTNIKMSLYLFLTGSDKAKGQYFVCGTDGNMSLNAHNAYSYTRNIAFFSYDGKMGLNTSSPAEALDVNGNAYIRGNLRLKNSGNYGCKLNMGDGEYVYLYEDADDCLTIYSKTRISLKTNNGIGIFVSNNGKIGVKTDSPTEAFDVNGTMMVRGYIYGNGTYGRFGLISGYADGEAVRIDTYNLNGSWSANGIKLLLNGNVIIGGGVATTTNKLHVAGVAYASTGIYSDGYVSARGQNTSSDVRLKKNLNAFEIALHQIAGAPSVSFDWRKDRSHDVGSIAQYWQGINPLLTPEDPQGMLTLQYGKTALLSVISVAKKTMRLEKRVDDLERENKELKRKIEVLERR